MPSTNDLVWTIPDVIIPLAYHSGTFLPPDTGLRATVPGPFLLPPACHITPALTPWLLDLPAPSKAQRNLSLAVTQTGIYDELLTDFHCHAVQQWAIVWASRNTQSRLRKRTGSRVGVRSSPWATGDMDIRTWLDDVVQPEVRSPLSR